MARYARASDVPFDHLVQFFEHAAKAQPRKKSGHLEYFRSSCVPRQADDIFQIYRLMLPHADRVRPNYMLKEAKLVELLVKALNISGDEAKKAQNWKDVGTKGAGDFPRVMYEYLLKRNCSKREGTPEARVLTIGQVNEWLDKLASEVEGEAPKAWTARRTEVLRWLVTHTTPTQMKWILSIILKSVKISMGEDRILKDFHVDALHLYNLSTDLQRVCQELKDPNKRLPRKDVEPGAPIRPQLCSMASSVDAAYDKMKGKEFVCEVKIDGERMQIHRTNGEVKYFSRRAREHGQLSEYSMFNTVVAQQVQDARCILDGELVVWNKVKKVFEPFGGLKSAMYAARDRKDAQERVSMRGFFDGVNTGDPDYETPMVSDIEIVYVCFDVLFLGNESVINRPLKERHQLLRRIIADAPADGILLDGFVRGRIVPLLPDVDTLNDIPFSRVGSDKAIIQDMYNRSLEKQEEGIVIKALDSEWKLNDRSGTWVKLKPDYVEVADVDALIIGGLCGTGKHGGQLSEWVLALADSPMGVDPSRFVSFCRVGTGIDDKTLKELRTRLAPYLIKNTGKAKAPKCYRITGSAKERPDFWVSDPMQSVVLQIKADIRTITSEQFATQQSLRFPRVMRVRWDKSPLDTTTEEEVIQQVAAGKGTFLGKANKQRDQEERLAGGKTKKLGKRAGGAARGGVVEGFRPVDVSGVDRVSNLLEGHAVYIANTAGSNPAEKRESRERLARIVARLGGDMHLQYSNRVDYMFAATADYTVRARIDAEAKGQATCDVIHTSWLESVDAAVEAAEREGTELEELPPVMPRHYLFLSYATRTAMAADMSIHGVPYHDRVTPADVSALLGHVLYKPDLKRTKDAAMKAAAAERAERGLPSDDRVPSARDYFTTGPVARDLGDLGLLNAKRTLFRRCNLLFVDPAPIQQKALQEQLQQEEEVQQQVQRQRHELQQAPGPRKLLAGVQEAVDASLSWQQRARDNEMKELALQVLLHGGTISQTMNPAVTHVVVRQAPGSEATCTSESCAPAGTPHGGPLSPLQLLQALKAAAGTDVRALYMLRKGLLSGHIQLVRHGWVEDSLAALEQRASAKRKSELLYLPVVTGASSAAGDETESGSHLRQQQQQQQQQQLVSGGSSREGSPEPSGTSAERFVPSQRQAQVLNVAAWPWKEVGVRADVAKARETDDEGPTTASAIKRPKRAPRGPAAKRTKRTAVAAPEEEDDEPPSQPSTSTAPSQPGTAAPRATAKAVARGRGTAARATAAKPAAGRKRPAKAAAAKGTGGAGRGKRRRDGTPSDDDSGQEEEAAGTDSSGSAVAASEDEFGDRAEAPPSKRQRPQRQAARRSAVVIDEPSESEADEMEDQQRQLHSKSHAGGQGAAAAAVVVKDEDGTVTAPVLGSHEDSMGIGKNSGGRAAGEAAPSGPLAPADTTPKRRLPQLSSRGAPGGSTRVAAAAPAPAAPSAGSLGNLFSSVFSDEGEYRGAEPTVSAVEPTSQPMHTVPASTHQGVAGSSQLQPSAPPHYRGGGAMRKDVIDVIAARKGTAAASAAAGAVGQAAGAPAAARGPLSRLERLMMEDSDEEGDGSDALASLLARAAPRSNGAAQDKAAAAQPQAVDTTATKRAEVQQAATPAASTALGAAPVPVAMTQWADADAGMPYTQAAMRLLQSSQALQQPPLNHEAHAADDGQAGHAGGRRKLPTTTTQQSMPATAVTQPRKARLADRVAKFL